MQDHIEHAKNFMLNVSPRWNALRSYEELKIHNIDKELHSYLEKNSIYKDNEAWIESLTKYMTLYEKR